MLKSVSTILQHDRYQHGNQIRNNCCQEMQLSLENDNTWFNRLILSDECTFYTLVEKLIDKM